MQFFFIMISGQLNHPDIWLHALHKMNFNSEMKNMVIKDVHSSLCNHVMHFLNLLDLGKKKKDVADHCFPVLFLDTVTSIALRNT